MAYYFAFGSCMHLDDIARTVNAKVVGAGRLEHYRLGFTKYSNGRQGGVADLIETPHDYAEGMVFEVEGFKELDAREGAPFFYERVRVPIHLTHEDRVVFATTYMIKNKESYEIQPTEEYANLIREGAKQLSPSYQRYLEKILSEKRVVIKPKPIVK